MIIGLAGKAGSGKDTVGNILYHSSSPLQGTRNLVSFAEPIKKAVNDLFSWDDRHSNGSLKEVVDPYWGFSPRHAYQTLGTEWGRGLLRDDIWLKIAEKKLSFAKNTIITDVRFKNEFEWVKERNGIVIYIDREQTTNVKSHSSETSLDGVIYDITIDNNGTLGELTTQVYSKLTHYIQDTVL